MQKKLWRGSLRHVILQGLEGFGLFQGSTGSVQVLRLFRGYKFSGVLVQGSGSYGFRVLEFRVWCGPLQALKVDLHDRYR